jgi:hypothetical protein
MDTKTRDNQTVATKLTQFSAATDKHRITEELLEMLISIRSFPKSVGAQNINSLPVDNSMLRIVNVVQQFMTEFNGAVSEEEKIVAITKIVSNLMKQNDH